MKQAPFNFQLKNFRWETDEDIGDDHIFFRFEIIKEGAAEEITTPGYTLHYVLKYIAKTRPEMHKYILKVRSTIYAWGPAEKQLMEELGDEIDWEQIVYEHLQKDGKAQQLYEHWHKMSNLPKATKRKASRKFNELKEVHQSIKEVNEDYKEFCSRVDGFAQKVAIEMYPEILDMPPEKAAELRHLFNGDTIAMWNRLREFTRETT